MLPSRRIAVFLSGGGRTLMNIVAAIEAGVLDAELALVVASRPCPGIEWARGRGFPAIQHTGTLTSEQLLELLSAHDADWAVLAGYLRLLPIPCELRGRIVNIHPALLPDFGGPGMHGDRVHQAVLEAGVPESGCTVHLCDDRYDTGPILAQSRCPVMPGDTVESLAARVFERECALYPGALDGLLSGAYDAQRLALSAGDA